MGDSVDVPKQRYLFIDLYRSAVIFLMLEGHVFRTFLPLNAQQSPFFQFHEFVGDAEKLLGWFALSGAQTEADSGRGLRR